LLRLAAVRTLLDYFNAIPNSQPVQIKTLTDNIAWAKSEKRIFLKHSLETRLAGMYVLSLSSSFSSI
jgi:26S proteasome regulatory subunit N6